MSTYAITLTAQMTEQVVLGRTQGFRLIVKLTGPVGFRDAGLFLYLRGTGPDNVTADIFQAVCSPENLNSYPLAAPGTPDPFLRLDNVDLVFTTEEQALDVKTDIIAEIKQLCDEMTKLLTDLSAPASLVIADDIEL